MKYTFILFVIFSLSGCSMLMPIEHQDRKNIHVSKAEAVWQAMHVIDMGQTLHIAKEPTCYREANPLTVSLIGEHPSEKEVIAVGILYAALYRWGSEFLERKDTLNENGNHHTPWVIAKYAFHTVGILTKGYTIANNHSIGLKPFGSGCP
jgi:hypothetical protein